MFGAAYGTAKSAVGICSMGVMRPELIMVGPFSYHPRLKLILASIIFRSLSFPLLWLVWLDNILTIWFMEISCSPSGIIGIYGLVVAMVLKGKVQPASMGYNLNQVIWLTAHE